MRFIDIENIITKTLENYFKEGWTISPFSSSGSQGELGKVDIKKGNNIIRFFVKESTVQLNLSFYDLVEVEERIYENKAQYFPSHYRPLWHNEGKLLNAYKFIEVDGNRKFLLPYSEQLINEINEKHHIRWTNDSTNTVLENEGYKKVALAKVKTYAGFKRAKIDNVTIERIVGDGWSFKIYRVRAEYNNKKLQFDLKLH